MNIEGNQAKTWTYLILSQQKDQKRRETAFFREEMGEISFRERYAQELVKVALNYFSGTRNMSPISSSRGRGESYRLSEMPPLSDDWQTVSVSLVWSGKKIIVMNPALHQT